MSDDDLLLVDDPAVIDLAVPPHAGDVRETTLGEVARLPAIRRAASRALYDLDVHHDHAPWIVVATDTPELLATSPSFDPELNDDWTDRMHCAITWPASGVPIALIPLGTEEPLSDVSAAFGAAELVVHALSQIVVAEHRAAVATIRAGRAEALASTDALTGLANQRAWWNRIAEEDARIERSAGHAVVAIIDLDDLKVVNDERGHLHGDLLLRLAAETLRELVRSCDIVARVGGDEFAVLAVDFNGKPELLDQRIESALEAAGIHASVGVATPEPGTTLIEAYDQADRAMYERKRRRRRLRTAPESAQGA